MAYILVQYLVWHFYDMPKEILWGWKNFLLFNLNFFSVPTLCRSFFSPWRKYQSFYGRKFEFKKNAEALVLNTMSRVIGMGLRIIIIIAGIFIELLILMAGFFIFLAWLLLPVFLVFLIYFACKQIIWELILIPGKVKSFKPLSIITCLILLLL